jgi:orotate phosphoribosyltransferase-like protein
MNRLTDAQKAEIQTLRAEGLGYKAIARKMSLSRDTVRSFCVRKKVTPAQPAGNALCIEKSKIRIGNTVFVITTDYSKSASETLEKKLERLILNAAERQLNSA